MVAVLTAAVAALALLLLLPATGDAAIRYKNTGEATLGGVDALADQRDACEHTSGRVWVSVDGRGDCVAYYPTSSLDRVGSKQDHAIIFFEGDVPASYRRDPTKLAGHLGGLRRALETLAQTYKHPYIMVARPGTFGSTGNHGDRRKMREFFVMNAAIDQLRTKYGLNQISLAGQSGGATIAAALLTLGRSDVRCATPASGAYDIGMMLDWHAERRGLGSSHREHPARLADDFNVMDGVTDIKTDPQRRVFVIADRGDTITPFHQQRKFAESLRAAGHRSDILEAAGAGADRHGLTLVSLRTAALCASGASDAEIRGSAQPSGKIRR